MRTLADCIKMHGSGLDAESIKYLKQTAKKNREDSGYDAHSAEMIAAGSFMDDLVAEKEEVFKQLEAASDTVKKSPYFKDTPDAVVMPISEVQARQPIITDEQKEKLDRGLTKMQAAAEGTGEKRAPISVFKRSDGVMVVVDGNTTYHALKSKGVKDLPVSVQPTLLQVTDDIDELYEAAEASRKDLKTFTEITAKELGGKAYFRPGNAVKDRVRADIKAVEYGTPGKLKDIIASTVSFKSEKDLRKALKTFTESSAVLELKDKFKNPMSSGYRDISMTVRMPNGHFAEVQFTTDNMLAAKNSAGHIIYDLMREVGLLSRTEAKKVYADLQALSRKYYDAAFESAPASSNALSSEIGIDVMRISKAIGDGVMSTLLDPSILKSFSALSSQTKGTDSASKNISDMGKPPIVESNINVTQKSKDVKTKKINKEDKDDLRTTEKRDEGAPKPTSPEQQVIDNAVEYLDGKGAKTARIVPAVTKSEKELEKVGNLFGQRVIFYKANKGSNMRAQDGLMQPGVKGLIFINKDAKAPMMFVLGHELLHQLRNTDFNLYKFLLENVAIQTGKFNEFKKYFQGLRSDEQAVTADDSFILEELMGNFAGDQFTSAVFWQKMHEKNSTFTERIIAAVYKLIEKFRFYPSTGSKYIADFQKSQDALVKAMSDFSAQTQQSLKTEEQDTEIKFSKTPKREKTSGRYVGAPAWIGSSPQKLGVLRKKLRQLAREGEPGRYWYERSSKAILDIAGGNVKEAERIVSLIALYSPNATVPANTTMALTAYYQWKNAQPIKAGFGMANKKAEALLSRGRMWKGIKTNAFYQNLMIEIDPSKVDPKIATMDMWMALAFDYGYKSLDQGTKYKFSQDETNNIAEEMGWKPHQVQAAIWTAVKSRVEPIRAKIKKKELELGIGEMYEQDGKQLFRIKSGRKYDHFKLVHKMAMASTQTVKDIKTASYDFSNALSERAAQLSWEATPSTNVDDVGFIHTADTTTKFKYLEGIQGLLYNKSGNDIIAQMVGLADVPHLFGYSAWEGEIGAGAQDFIPVPTQGSGKNKVVKKSARNILNLYASIRGLVLRQDMVVWHVPVYQDAKKRHNGFELRTSRPVSEKEMTLLYSAIHKKFDTWDLAPGYIENGVRVLNFTDNYGNIEFQKGMDEVISTLPDNFGGGNLIRAGYRSDGEALTNDWTEDTNGEEYTNKINSRRPDLSGRIADLRSRIEAFNEEFSKKYAPELSKTDKSRSQGTIQLTHWGRTEGLKELDPSYHGQGLRGAESKRKESDPDYWVNRTYFGLEGYKKEPGLGNKKYTASIPAADLYDFQQDPDNLKSEIKNMPSKGWPSNPLNVYETLIQQAGYRGYISGDVAAVFDVMSVEPGVESDIKFSTAPKSYKPKKTVKAYKLFRTLKTQPGKIFPLFIGKTKPTPIGKWIKAEFLPTKGFAQRPGWHSGTMPSAPHLMRKDGTMAPDRVWAEIEIPDDVDWQKVADKTKTKDIRNEVPVDGFYRFKRPGAQGLEWRISGAIKINKLLTEDEVAEINNQTKRPTVKTPREQIRLSTPGDTKTKEFKVWSKGYPVVEGKDISKIVPGKGVVVKAFHGTTHEFYKFDASVKGTKEGHLGQVNYFTSNKTDASGHYAGTGPDLTRRVEDLAEQLSDMPMEQAEAWAEDNGFDPDEVSAAKGNITALEQLVEELLVGDTAKTMKLNIRMDNPAIINGAFEQTWIDVKDIKPAIMRAVQDVTGRPREGGKVFSMLELNAADMSATELDEQLRASDELMKISDYFSEGEMLEYHVIGQVFKHLGYDGIIMQNAETIFKGMKLEEDTAHIHIFDEYVNQIKDTDNLKPTDLEDIRLSTPDPEAVAAGKKELKRIMTMLQQYRRKDEFKVSRTKTRSLIKKYIELKKRIADRQITVENKVKDFKKLLMQMPIHVRGKALAGFPRIVTAKRPETKERYFQAARRKAEKEVNNYFRRETLKKIQKLRRQKIKKKGHKESRFGAEATATLELVNKLFKNKKLKTAAGQRIELAKLHAEKAELESNDPSPKNNRELRKVADKISVTEMFGGYREASLAELEAARQTLQDILDGGRVKWKLAEERRKSAAAEVVNILSQEITGEEIPKHETRAQKTNRELKQQKFLAKIRRKISNFDTLHSSWHFLMDKLSRLGAGKTLRTRTVERMGDLVQAATDKGNDLNQVAVKMLQEKLQSLTGKKGYGLMLWVNRMSKATTKYDIDSVDAVTGKVVPEKITLSQMQAAYWWAIGRRGDALAADGNDSINERLDAMGVTKDFIKQIESRVDPKVLDLAVWLSDTMGEHIWQLVNPIHEARYGTSLTHSDAYTVIKADYNQGREDSDLFQKLARGSSMIKGSMHELTNTKLGIKDANLLEVWVDHIHDMNHFTAWAIPVQQLESVFSNQSLRNHIERVHGQAMNGYISDWIEIFKGSSAQHRDHLSGLAKWRGRFATAVLGANPTIYIKQLTSIPAMAADIPVVSWNAGIASFMANPVKAVRILKQSQFIKTRYEQGHVRDVKSANAKTIGQLMGGKSSIPSKLMGLVKMGDMQAIYVGGWAVYRHYNKKYLKQGMSKDKAHKQALKRFSQTALQTQQTGEAYGQSLIQHGSAWQQFFTMFMSAPILYYMQVSAGLRNLKKSPVDSIKRLVLFWVIVPALFEAIASAPLAIDEDEEDRETFMKRVTRGVVLGPVNGLFLARDISKMFYNAAFMRSEMLGQGYSSMTKPVEDVTKMITQMAKLAEEGVMDWAEFNEAIVDLIGVTSGYPLPAVQNYLQGIQQILDEDTEHPGAKIMGYTNWTTGDKK